VKARIVVVVTALAVLLGMAAGPPASASAAYDVTVRVLAAGGAPIPQRWVELMVPGDDAWADLDGDSVPDGRVGAGYTSADGTLTFAAVPEGSYTTWASSTYMNYPVPVTVAGGPATVTVTQTHVAKVTGVVRDAVTGKPVPAARLFGWDDQGHQSLELTSGTDGTFSAFAEAGTFTVNTVADDYRYDNPMTTFVVKDGVDRSVEIRIAARERLSGRVSLNGSGRATTISLGSTAANTSRSGTYAEFVDPGTIAPVVDGDWATYFTTYYGNTVRKQDARRIKLAHGQRIDHVDIALVGSATVTGTVVDSKGHAAKYADVTAQNLDRTGSAKALTDSKGRYTLRGLASGKVQVTVWGGTDKKPASGWVTVTAKQGASVKATKVALANDAVLYGRIATAGSSASKQDVTVTDSKGSVYGTFRPDSEGWVGIAGLPAHTYYVNVDGSNVRKKVVVKAHRMVSFGTISRGKLVTVKGTVRTASGKAASGVRVTVVDSHGMSYGSTRTSSKGAYSIKAAVSGAYTIVAYPKSTSDGWTSAPVTVRKGKTLTKNLRLGQGAIVTGVVLNSKGKPAIGVRVETLDGRKATTNSAGVYTIKGLRAGRTGLWVHDPAYVGGYRDTVVTVTAKAGKTVKAKRATVR